MNTTTPTDAARDAGRPEHTRCQRCGKSIHSLYHHCLACQSALGEDLMGDAVRANASLETSRALYSAAQYLAELAESVRSVAQREGYAKTPLCLPFIEKFLARNAKTLGIE